MGNGNVVTTRSASPAVDPSTDLSVERLEPIASAPALQGQAPAAEVSRKARRRPRPRKRQRQTSSSLPSPDSRATNRSTRLTVWHDYRACKHADFRTRLTRLNDVAGRSWTRLKDTGAPNRRGPSSYEQTLAAIREDNRFRRLRIRCDLPRSAGQPG